jgi:hypothetical protein
MKATRLWNIALNSIVDHLNDKIKSRLVNQPNVKTKEEDMDIVVYILSMHNVTYL